MSRICQPFLSARPPSDCSGSCGNGKASAIRPGSTTNAAERSWSRGAPSNRRCANSPISRHSCSPHRRGHHRDGDRVFSGWAFGLADSARAPVAFLLAVISLLLGGYWILFRHNRSAASVRTTLFVVLAAAAIGPNGLPGGRGAEIVSLVLVAPDPVATARDAQGRFQGARDRRSNLSTWRRTRRR